MIENVSHSGVQAVRRDYTSQQENIKKLIQYKNGEVLNEKPDTFTSNVKSAAGSAALFEGIPFVSFLLKNKKVTGSFKSDYVKELDDIARKSFQNIFKGEGKVSSRISSFVSTSLQNRKTYSDVKSYVKQENNVRKLQEKLNKLAGDEANGKLRQKAIEKIEQKLGKAGEKLAGATETLNGSMTAAAGNAGTAAAKPAGKISQALSKLVSKLPGGTKVAGKLSKASKLLKSSGAGVMFVFSGIIEGTTEVIPTFKELGAKKGIKQLGKSTIKVAGDTFGFIAGENIGVAAGTAIGTAICPGFGTAIGTVAGLACGMLGSFAAGKVTKAITGKTEREIAKEQQEEALASQIADNDTELEQLKQEVLQQIQSDYETNNGTLSEDAQTAAEILAELEAETSSNDSIFTDYAAV